MDDILNIITQKDGSVFGYLYNLCYKDIKENIQPVKLKDNIFILLYNDFYSCKQFILWNKHLQSKISFILKLYSI